MDTVFKGTTRDNVKITVLPYRQVCRSSRCHVQWQDQVYVWHQGSQEKTKEAKREKARQSNVWLLRDDWQEITDHSKLTGKKWLNAIMA